MSSRKPLDQDKDHDKGNTTGKRNKTILVSIVQSVGSMYLSSVLYIPRLLLRWNMKWNPLIIFGKRFIEQALLDAGYHYQGVDTRKDQGAEEKDSRSRNKNSRPRRWLDAAAHPEDLAYVGQQHIVLASYPRSGNSLLRHLLEELTGIYTGCDTRPDRKLSLQLQEGGMKGEGIVDDSVLFVKSHYPERHGWKPFRAKKAIVIIRNPWDSIDSYFNMTLTNSHHKSIHPQEYARFADRWQDFLENEIQVWMKFYRFWTRPQAIPVMLVRYEDLLLHRHETLRRISAFIQPRESSDLTQVTAVPTDVLRRIAELSPPVQDHNNVPTSSPVVGPYTPRSGKIASSFKHYSASQFQYIQTSAREYLKSFGYDPETQDFPHSIVLPKRQVIKARGLSSSKGLDLDSDVDDQVEAPSIVINSTEPVYELRKPEDTCGRKSTSFRQSLLDPVRAKDGTALNMHEVLLARERKRRLDINSQTSSVH